MINPLIDLMDRSKRMPATNVHTRHDGTVVVMGDKPRVPPAGCDFSLRELMLPANFGSSVDYRVHFPMGEAAGRQTTLSTALMKVSRVAKAGAVIFMVDESPKPVSQAGGILVYPQHKKSFLTIEAADFAVVADGAEVGISTLPVFRSEVDLANMTTYGFRVEMNRSEMKNFEEGLLSDTALASIYMGVARIADKALLDAINATNPPAFSLAAVAAKGYEFAELRALIGTNADKAEIGQDGTLRAGGLLAELTPDSVTTLAGSWPRAAVAVHERITLTVQLLNPMTGSMAVTCWVHCQPMIPDATAFWTVPGEVSLMSFGVNHLDEPAGDPPVDEAPIDEPPVDETPADEPPIDEPPVEEPPVEPEATEPPVEPGV